LDWQAVQVADGSTQVNAESGKGYFLDTNVGVIEVFLPTSPSRGDVVGLVDYAGTFATNKVIVNTGGANIDSTATGDVQLTTNNAIVECVYVDSAKGWLVYINQAAGTTPSGIGTPGGSYDAQYIVATGGTITTTGDFKIHTFTGDGCFVVSSLGNQCGSASTVDYLVVAGGGAGGAHGDHGAGGGAGGFRESHSSAVSGCYTASPLATPTGITVTATTYPVTVGAGATAAPAPSSVIGPSGSNSVFSTITSTGGGGGALGNVCAAKTGVPGGSGGGGGTLGATTYPGGSGNTPPTSPSQGNNGGTGSSDGATYRVGGGGGGAGAVGGSSPSNTNNSVGGDGVTTSISGSPTSYGGGGGSGATYLPGAAGGLGGGGAGGSHPAGNGVTGTSNTGGGGGGSAACGGSAGSGGKGIVIIRYKYQ